MCSSYDTKFIMQCQFFAQLISISLACSSWKWDIIKLVIDMALWDMCHNYLSTVCIIILLCSFQLCTLTNHRFTFWCRSFPITISSTNLFHISIEVIPFVTQVVSLGSCSYSIKTSNSIGNHSTLDNTRLVIAMIVHVVDQGSKYFTLTFYTERYSFIIIIPLEMFSYYIIYYFSQLLIIIMIIKYNAYTIILLYSSFLLLTHDKNLKITSRELIAIKYNSVILAN